MLMSANGGEKVHVPTLSLHCVTRSKHPGKRWLVQIEGRRRLAINPQIIIAPTTAPISPAPSSALYHPMAWPRYVAKNAPTNPVVRINCPNEAHGISSERDNTLARIPGVMRGRTESFPDSILTSGESGHAITVMVLSRPKRLLRICS